MRLKASRDEQPDVLLAKVNLAGACRRMLQLLAQGSSNNLIAQEGELINRYVQEFGDATGATPFLKLTGKCDG